MLATLLLTTILNSFFLKVIEKLKIFDSLALEDMTKVSLMNRQDTKYVFSEDKLLSVLDKLSKFYNILEIDGLRQMSYSNIYFDTDEFMFYHNHHRDKLNRYKIRNRQYDDSNLAFCEVKFKSNAGRTEKNRIQVSALLEEYDESSKDFLKDLSPVAVSDLKAKVFMRFDRITLVHKQWKDRCTLDMNLTTSNKETDFDFKGLVIAEIKQEKFTPQCDFNLVLKSESIYPDSFSKYSMSVVKLFPNLKNNRFKPRWLALNKILKP